MLTRRTSTTRNREPENERWLPTVEEVSGLVRTTQHPLKRAIIGLFAKTGIGVGELCNLCMADIFLDDRDVSEAYDIWEFDWVKSGHPALRIRVEGDKPYSPRRERVEATLVPLDEPMRRVLKRWLAVRSDTRRESRPLFVSTYSWSERLSPLTAHNSVESRLRR